MRLNALSKKELLGLAKQLYDNLEYRKKNKRKYMMEQGLTKRGNGRVTYEFIEMDDIEDDLFTVLANFHYNNRYSYNWEDNLLLLKVCLAAMCQLVKSPYYTKSYMHAFYEATGLEFDTNRMYPFLREAFEAEGIMPLNWDMLEGTFRYKDTLINEAGIPQYLIGKIIDFFLLYWKYLKEVPIEDVFNLLKIIKANSNFRFENGDLAELLKLRKSLIEYPRKVIRVVSQLKEVSELLEAGNYSIEDLDNTEVVSCINQVLAFDIFRILPRKESLKSLYNRILNRVTPNKFSTVLKSKPSQLYVTTPRGTYKRVSDYKDILLGEHLIENIKYTVVIDKNLQNVDLLNWKYDHIVQIGDEVGYRSDAKFRVFFGKYREGNVYPLYVDGYFEGYFWYGSIPNGLPVRIGSEVIQPKQHISYNTYFKYFWDDKIKTYSFKVSITDFRIYLPKYRDRQISLRSSFSKISRDFMLDSSGSREIEKVDFPMDTESYKCKYSISLFLKNTDEYTLLEELNPMEIERFYVFNKVDKTIVRPGTHQYGYTDFLILLSPDCNETILYDSNNASLKEYTTNVFRIFKLTWDNYKLPLIFKIGENKWEFRESLIFYLREENDDCQFDEDEEQYDEYSKIEEIKYEVVTNLPEQEYRNNIFLIVFYGEDIHREYKLSTFLKIEHGKYFIKGSQIKGKIGLHNDYIGKLTLSFIYNQKKIFEKQLIIYPQINIKGLHELYVEGEPVYIKLTSDTQCFYENGIYENEITVNLGPALLTICENEIEPEIISGEVFLPNIEKFYSYKFTPNILAYRFVDKSSNFKSYIHTSSVNLCDISNYDLLVIGKKSEQINICLNGFTKSLSSDANGKVLLKLDNIKRYIGKRTSKLELKQLNRTAILSVVWEARVYEITQVNPITDSQISLEIDYEGPQTTHIIISIVDKYGTVCEEATINCPGHRVKNILYFKIPEGYSFDEIMVNIFYEHDEENFIAQLLYKVKKKKWYSEIEIYPFDKFKKDLDRIVSHASDFIEEEVL